MNYTKKSVTLLTKLQDKTYWMSQTPVEGHEYLNSLHNITRVAI